ncbi:MAG TPA: CDP-alcohol phosphatidyltransferase family protein [Planctomycetota bacterium]|jgi:phosphatidylglycerophosphate synthase|nr:CDP-alcohol phosphatidyltransferase family protein [Planctomycetota bacterium]
MSGEAAAHRAWLSLPNLLTLSRLPMAGLAWIRPNDPVYVLGLMALAGLSDVLDGWLERKRRERLGLPQGGESLGAWLDPLCDKVFILSVLVAITSAHSLPWWIIPLIALREILQTLIVAGTRVVPALKRALRPRFKANVLGKLTTVVQFVTIGAILLNRPGAIPLAFATALMGLIAVAVYVRRAMRAD